MPSLQHEVSVALFRARTSLMSELLSLLGVDVPRHSAATVESENLTQVDPAAFAADAVVVLRDAAGLAVQAVVLELQIRIDPRKRYTWSVYVAVVAHRYQCPVQLLVVTPRRKTAAWARQPIEVVPDYPWKPLVVGPDELPAIVDPEVAKQAPELAVLSAFVHGREQEVELAARVAYAARQGCLHRGGEEGLLYWELVDASPGEEVAHALEAVMEARREEDYGYFARKHREEGREEGRQEGREEGLRKGLEVVLMVRFGPLPEWAAVRLSAATGEVLEGWFQRAPTAGSLEEALTTS